MKELFGIRAEDNGREPEHCRKAFATTEEVYCSNPKCITQRKELIGRVAELERQLRIMSAWKTPPRYIGAFKNPQFDLWIAFSYEQ